MLYPCPECHDKGTQKISLMYESSTHRWKNYHGTVRTSQSDLASRYAPPKRRGYMWPTIFVVFFAPAVGVLLGLPVEKLTHSTMLSELTCLAFLGASVHWFIIRAYRYNHNIWPAKYKEWDSLFYCKACGRTFNP